jgi:cyclase
MLKKRIIFTLLYDSGNFMLSRNFRLQKVGNLDWLKKNYDFSKISFFIDELIVIDISRVNRDIDNFCKTLQALTDGCFIPICAGGGVRSAETARKLLRSGADKILVNTPLFTEMELVSKLASEFGQQCIVASVDYKKTAEEMVEFMIESGNMPVQGCPTNLLAELDNGCIGELYLNSIDRDGTGQGYDFTILNFLPENFNVPVIMAGGAGNSSHLQQGLNDSRIDAVATAHLFNFVGDGLKQARNNLLQQGVELASWPEIGDLLGNQHSSGMSEFVN